MTWEIREAGGRAACALLVGIALGLGCAPRPAPRGTEGVTVELASGAIVLDASTTRDVVDALTDAEGGRGVHAIVVLREPPSLPEIEALHDRGVRLLNRVDDRALLAVITRTPLEQALGPGAFAALVPTRAKLADDLIRRVDAEAGSSERVEVVVQLHDDVTDADRIAALLPPGATPWLGQAWTVVVPLSDLLDVAALDEVSAVDEVPEPRQSGEAQRIATRVDEVQVLGPDGKFTGRTGAGIRIGVIDRNGMNPDHPDFRATDGSGKRVIRHEPLAGPGKLHAMSMAMAAAGNGHASQLAGFGLRGNRGHAAEALLSNVRDVGGGYAALLLLDDDVHVVTSGKWLEKGGKYGVHSSEVDRLVRGDTSVGGTRLPARPHVWAAGNAGFDDGYTSLKIASKNAIVVGSSDTSDDTVSLFSSRGPTMDGRLKPDIVAPGAVDTEPFPYGGVEKEDLLLSGPGESEPYADAWGSSFSAPAVAGILALVMEELASQGIDPRELAPSTYRALLAATATDLAATVPASGGGTVTYHEGPDHATGHGLVDAVEAVAVAKNRMRWSELTLVAPGQAISSAIFLPADVDELVVALAWDDRPGSTWAAAPALVHDLDVRVLSPFGQTFHPSTIEPPAGGQAKPATANARDARNTLEVARIADPPAGTWLVTVDAKWLGLGCSQVASLVTSHPHVRIAWIEPLPWSPRPPLEWLGELIEPATPTPAPGDAADGAQTWLWPPGAIMPVDLVIQPAQVCLVWTMTPIVELVVDGLPTEAMPVAFDERGPLDVDVERSGGRAQVRFERRDVTRPTFLAITDPEGRPWPDDLRPRIAVRSPPPPERRR